jgi:hypothetical protein
MRGARQLEWLTVAVCACFRQRYTTRSVDLLCRICSVTYRNNIWALAQLGGVSSSHEKAVSNPFRRLVQTRYNYALVI